MPKKRMWLGALVGCAFALPLALHAEVVTESRLAPVLARANAETLVAFDIDSTLLLPAQMLGSDAWIVDQVKQAKAAGEDSRAAMDRIIGTWVRIQELTSVVPVEPETAALVAAAQQSGLRLMGLTARASTMAKVTGAQLHSAQIFFDRSAVSPKSFSFGAEGGWYEGGIVYGGWKSKEGHLLTREKGPLLVEFLRRLKLKPAKVLFVDDRASNVESVDRALAEAKIPCDCVRYSAADGQYAAYDPAVAAVQQTWMEKLLSDEVARVLVKAPKPKQ